MQDPRPLQGCGCRKCQAYYNPKLYTLKQTPGGSVVVLGARVISDYEMPTAHAQQTADWLNDRRKHAC